MNSNMRQTMIDTFARIKMKICILANETGHRPGGASRVCRLGDRSQGFTPIVTRQSTTLYLATSKKGAHMRARYYNKYGTIKESKHGYKLMLMKRLTKHKKLRESKKYESYNHILRQETLSYITALACLNVMGITEPINHLSNLKKVLCESGDIAIDQCLVHWMCTTGEMRNHQAVGCHCDGNKSHPLEIYSVFDREGIEKKDAYLYLPLDNIVLRFKCGHHLMVCNLTDTPHVADQSRDVNNFSKVHGPCPWP